MGSNYCISRKSKLLRDFDKMVKRVRNRLVSYYGAELTNDMVEEVRLEYENLIPQLPYIGGKQPFTQFIIATAQFLAMYRVLRAHGRTVEETGK